MQNRDRKLLVTRRVFLASMSACGSGLAESDDRRPVSIGAIRWDAWYDPADGRVARAAENALAPAEFHYRMPFFGTELDANRVRINGYSQRTLDQEIGYAADAGLSYWAFDSYEPDSPMTNALKLYLSSDRRREIGFCMIGSVANGGAPGRPSGRMIHDMEMMREEGYTRVRDGRPLYYLLAAPDDQTEREWGGTPGVKGLVEFLRSGVETSSPYIVLLHGDPERAANLARQTGCDAIGSYAISRSRSQAPFSQLTRDAEDAWDQMAKTGHQVVPTVMTGWDERPIIEHPPYWASHLKTVRPDQYYQRATPEEIARQTTDAIEWTNRNRAASAGTILVYAWNECIEGFGALVPNYRPGGAPDVSRLAALKQILRRDR